MVKLPFRIAGLALPMITYNGKYSEGIAELAERIVKPEEATTIERFDLSSASALPGQSLAAHSL